MKDVRRRPASRGWVPLQRGTRIVSEEVLERAKTDQNVADHLARSDEVWSNDRYVVTVYRHAEEGWVTLLSIRRADHKAIQWDWRHLQKIKTEIAGPDVEGFQLYPKEGRVVDTANQYWMWCLPPGVDMPVGFPSRSIGHEDEVEFGAVQRAWEPGLLPEGEAR